MKGKKPTKKEEFPYLIRKAGKAMYATPALLLPRVFHHRSVITFDRLALVILIEEQFAEFRLRGTWHGNAT